MSSLVHTERCPRCASKGGDRSGNNLAVYSDGHKWCYSCGLYIHGDIIEKFKQQKETKPVSNSYMFSPSSTFDKEGIKWLKKYGLTKEEIENNFFWDDRGYCVFNGGKYQCGRNFSGRGSKYIIRGLVRGNEVIFTKASDNWGKVSEGANDSERLLSSLSSSIVIVEDAISAIKVSRVTSSVPIHNSIIPVELLVRLSKRFKRCIVWLDPDKQKESLTEANKASLYFEEVNVVWATKDPKEFTTQEIKDILLK